MQQIASPTNDFNQRRHTAVSIVKTIAIGLIFPQGLSGDEDAQQVCQFEGTQR